MKTSPKRSTAAARKTPDEQQSPTDDRMVILVRRGALRRFDALTQKTAELPVIISWDRRQGERRKQAASGTVERRGTDRRQSAPFTWALADFVVLPSTTLPFETPAGNTDSTTKKAPRPRARARKPVLKAVRRKNTRTK